MLVQVLPTSAHATMGHVKVQLSLSVNKFEKLHRSKFMVRLLTELSSKEDNWGFSLFKCAGLLNDLVFGDCGIV